jgi:hypothetical protein
VYGGGGGMEGGLLMAWYMSTVVPGNIVQSFETFGYPFKCKKKSKGLILIWQTVIWCIWKARNSIIF